ncbi:MAG: glycosyltransferase family 87 protein, partial [Burkholderiales bacterium]
MAGSAVCFLIVQIGCELFVATARCIGSGTVIVSVVVVVLFVLLALGYWTGWGGAWRSFGVPIMQPEFRDMHAVTDHAECMVKGFNAYFLNPCDPQRTPFNYPPVWLWLGYLGIGSADAAWLSVLISIAALVVLVVLLRGRSIYAGALASLAILSPSVMLGIERGNIDLLILALVGGAALVVAQYKPTRLAWAMVPLALAVVLKLYPVFCVALVARRNRLTMLFSAVLAVISLVYFANISDYIFLIETNTPMIHVV